MWGVCVGDDVDDSPPGPSWKKKTNLECWTGDSQVERRYCAAPLLYSWPTSPSARHITLYIYLLCPRRRILLRLAYCLFDDSEIITDMEGMNVDEVSERISNLGITTATEHSATTTFLSLPFLVKWNIYTHLHSKDCIALSSTCRQMYGFNTFAYTHLQFLPPNSLFSLARSVHRLAEVLARSPHYAQAVRTLRIVGWNAINVPDGYDFGTVYRALDEGVTTILKNAPLIYSLNLDLSLTKAIHRFSQTLVTLTRVRTVRDLRLVMFSVPMCMAENDSLQGRTPDQAPPAYERVSLRVCSGARLPVIMQDPRKLRWFGFTILGTWNRGDKKWDMTLQRVAEAATELETLVLENREHFDANTLGQTLQSGFEREVLGKLRSFSVNMITLCLSSLRQLFRGFSRSSVTHLRIVVYHYGIWLSDIGPQYILELAKWVPNLEEISLDQVGMLNVTPLPGDPGAWGEAFRKFKKLRRIVFASMFVLDLYRPAPVDDDEEDYGEDEEEGPRVGEDAGMDVDEGDEGYETDEGRNDDAPADDTLKANLVLLAAWADMFFDDHLRMLEPFTEIWFVDPRFPGRTAGGFIQRVMEGEGEGGRAEHMIQYPILKRDGWWWDERDPIPLD